MANDFAGLFSFLERAFGVGDAALYEPTMDEEAQSLLADVQNRYGVYQEGWAGLADATVLDRASQGYPPDEPLLRTGSLREANTYGLDRSHEEVVAYVGIPANDPNAPIARAQEYGTLGTPSIPPRPVLAPAARAHEHEIVDALGARVGVILEGGAR